MGSEDRLEVKASSSSNISTNPSSQNDTQSLNIKGLNLKKIKIKTTTDKSKFQSFINQPLIRVPKNIIKMEKVGEINLQNQQKLRDHSSSQTKIVPKLQKCKMLDNYKIFLKSKINQDKMIKPVKKVESPMIKQQSAPLKLSDSQKQIQYQELRQKLNHILYKHKKRKPLCRPISGAQTIGYHTPSKRLMRERSSPGIRNSSLGESL